MGLPVIVMYPDFDEKSDVINCETKKIKKKIEDLWDKLPKFRDSMTNVPTQFQESDSLPKFNHKQLTGSGWEATLKPRIHERLLGSPAIHALSRL